MLISRGVVSLVPAQAMLATTWIDEIRLCFLKEFAVQVPAFSEAPRTVRFAYIL